MGLLQGLLLPGPPCLWQAILDPYLHKRPSNTSMYVWFSLLWGYCSFLLGPDACKILFVLFPPVLRKSYNQIPPTFKVRFTENPQSLFRIPSLGTLIWGSEPSQQWENFGIIVLQFVHCSPSVSGFDFIMFVPLLHSHCSLFIVFEHGVFFFFSEFQHSPVDGCSTSS